MTLLPEKKGKTHLTNLLFPFSYPKSNSPPIAPPMVFFIIQQTIHLSSAPSFHLNCKLFFLVRMFGFQAMPSRLIGHTRLILVQITICGARMKPESTMCKANILTCCTISLAFSHKLYKNRTFWGYSWHLEVLQESPIIRWLLIRTHPVSISSHISEKTCTILAQTWSQLKECLRLGQWSQASQWCHQRL